MELRTLQCSCWFDALGYFIYMAIAFIIIFNELSSLFGFSGVYDFAIFWSPFIQILVGLPNGLLSAMAMSLGPLVAQQELQKLWWKNFIFVDTGLGSNRYKLGFVCVCIASSLTGSNHFPGRTVKLNVTSQDYNKA